jgi:hypothetical protein
MIGFARQNKTKSSAQNSLQIFIWFVDLTPHLERDAVQCTNDLLLLLLSEEFSQGYQRREF